jgi:DNA-damage-inducible protein J
LCYIVLITIIIRVTLYVQRWKELFNMAQTTLSIRMDEDVKKQFDAFCAAVGMNTSVAINLFAKAVLREGRIPFEISTKEDPFYSASNQARLKKSMETIIAGKGIVHELIEDADEEGVVR